MEPDTILVPLEDEDDYDDGKISLLQWCHAKALEHGVFVPWKDSHYREPRYSRLIYKDNGLISRIETFDILSQSGDNYAIDSEELSLTVYCFIGNRDDDTVSVNDTIGKQLFIGNNGVIFLVNADTDMCIVRLIDIYLGNFKVGKPEPHYPGCANKFGLVTTKVFEQYLRSLII